MSTWEQINEVYWGKDIATDNEKLLKPSDTYIKNGYGAYPKLEFDNWLEWLQSNNLAALETAGFPPYFATTTYGTYAIVRSGTKLWISLQNANTGNDPSTEPTWWKDFFVWLSEQAGTEQTNATIASFNEAYFYPHPEYVSGKTVNLVGDNILLPNLTIYPLSANPLAITSGTLTQDTWYYIYVDEPAGSDIVAGDCEITTVTPTWDASIGMFKSGTKRCIGYVEGNHSGNGDAEPFITSAGWYQRRDEKKQLAIYTPAPQTKQTLNAGVPNFDGKGLVEVTSFSHETYGNAFAYVENTGFVGNLGDKNLNWGSEPNGYDYNGQVSVGISVNDVVAAAGTSLIITDSSGNIYVSGHEAGGAQDEALSIWLRKFQLPRGIFTR